MYVNYYGGGYYGSDDGTEGPAQPLITAQVTVITEEGTPSEKQENFIVPMRQPGESPGEELQLPLIGSLG